MDLTPAAFALFIASGALPSDPTQPWWSLLSQGSLTAAMMAWLMWRDGKEREKRDAEHAENAKLQRENIDALNLMTQGNMVYVLALKHLDGATRDLATSIKEQADDSVASSRK